MSKKRLLRALLCLALAVTAPIVYAVEEKLITLDTRPMFACGDDCDRSHAVDRSRFAVADHGYMSCRSLGKPYRFSHPAVVKQVHIIGVAVPDVEHDPLLNGTYPGCDTFYEENFQ